MKLVFIQCTVISFFRNDLINFPVWQLIFMLTNLFLFCGFRMENLEYLHEIGCQTHSHISTHRIASHHRVKLMKISLANRAHTF